MKLSPEISGYVRTFAYFLASGTHRGLKGVDYLDLFGSEPSAIEQVFAILLNVLEVDENGHILNGDEAQQRAVDYLRQYCDPTFEVQPPYADWELALHPYPRS